jgi:hypothetical protein
MQEVAAQYPPTNEPGGRKGKFQEALLGLGTVVYLMQAMMLSLIREPPFYPEDWDAFLTSANHCIY